MSSSDVEVITVTKNENFEDNIIETEDFKRILQKELSSKTLWRKLDSLAYSVNVDVDLLKKYLDKTNGILRKIGKENTIFYCLENRISEEKEKIIKNTKLDEEKNYSLAMLHMVYWNFHKVLKTYGLEISRIDQESFNMLVQALDKMESGMILFSKKTDSSIDKLPNF